MIFSYLHTTMASLLWNRFRPTCHCVSRPKLRVYKYLIKHLQRLALKDHPIQQLVVHLFSMGCNCSGLSV